MDEDRITVAEAAAEMGVSKTRVEQFLRAGRLSICGTTARVRLLSRAQVLSLKAALRSAAGKGKPPTDSNYD